MSGSMLNRLFCQKTNDFLIQFVRYVFSGGVAFVVDKSLFLLFRYSLHVNKYVATSVGFLAGLAITYLLSVLWIFGDRRMKNTLLEVLVFSAIGVIGLLLMNLFVWLFSDLFSIQDDFCSNLLATALVTLWNFVAKKYILFTKGIKHE